MTQTNIQQNSNRGRSTVIKQLIISFVILLLLCPAAHAVPEDDSGFGMDVPGVRSLTLDDESLYMEPGIIEMLDGFTDPEVITASVCANVTWVLTIRGSDELWDGPWDKPITDIYWNYNGGDYVPLGMDSAYIVSGGPCNQVEYPINFKVKLDMEYDLPGEYYYEYIVFELSAP